MGLLTKLTDTGGSLLSEFNGKTPPKDDSTSKNSTLHNKFSISGEGTFPTLKPSLLDLGGDTPLKYIDNLPQ
jgi:hypothetical protein